MRILLIQNSITNYNLPIYKILSEESNINLTIAHFSKNINYLNQTFKVINLKIFTFLSLKVSFNKIYSICNNYDVVIAMADLHWLNLMLLGFHKKRKFKLIYWGIGVSASIANKFDFKTRWNKLRFFLMNRADALLFYSDYPISKYIKNGFDSKKLFVADNTVEVNKSDKKTPSKKTIIFIGTLYKEKGIYDLLNSYIQLNKLYNLPILNIIGSGAEYKKIEKLISLNNLNDKIKLLGSIFDNKLLEVLFSEAIACISPKQAGLSVLLSMGFGVPFITKYDAITGGEIFNIKDKVNGILYKKDSELNEILLDLIINKEKYSALGIEANNYYQKYRTPRQMANGFLNAINYVINNR